MKLILAILGLIILKRSRKPSLNSLKEGSHDLEQLILKQKNKTYGGINYEAYNGNYPR